MTTLYLFCGAMFYMLPSFSDFSDSYFYDMLKYVLIFMAFMLNLVLVGVTTLMESKSIGSVQCSSGLYKAGLFGTMQFMFDFFKLVVKKTLMVFKSSYVMLLLLVFLFLDFLFLPVTDFGFLFPYAFFMSVVFEVFILIIKYVYLCNIHNMFSLISSYSHLSSVLVFDSFFLLFSIFFVIQCFGVGIVYWTDLFLFYHGSGSNYFFYILYCLLVVFVFINTLMEISSTPFDYLESESELMGGFSMDKQGIFYCVMSLVEYGLMNNSTFFVSFFCFPINANSVIYELLLSMLTQMVFIIMICFFSGVLVRFSTNALFSWLTKNMFNCLYVFLILLFMSLILYMIFM